MLSLFAAKKQLNKLVCLLINSFFKQRCFYTYIIHLHLLSFL